MRHRNASSDDRARRAERYARGGDRAQFEVHYQELLRQGRAPYYNAQVAELLNSEFNLPFVPEWIRDLDLSEFIQAEVVGPGELGGVWFRYLVVVCGVVHSSADAWLTSGKTLKEAAEQCLIQLRGDIDLPWQPVLVIDLAFMEPVPFDIGISVGGEQAWQSEWDR